MKKRMGLLLALLLCASAIAVAEDGSGETTSSFLWTEDEVDGEVAATAAVVLQTAAPDVDEGWPREIVITVGGDCTLGTTDALRIREDGFDSVVTDKGMAWPFSGLLSAFSADDLTLVNFEGTLTESEDKTEGKKFNFKGPAEYAQMLVLGSVEAVTLANNHYGDYGDEGREDTRAALDAHGITYTAQGAPAVYEVRGVKIGLIGHTFPYTDGKRDISKEVDALREEGCQIVLVFFHWGSEYEPYTRDQRNIGRAAIKAGADAVIGHHPHIIQPIERYEDTYILYSLGNLVFGGNIDPDDRDAYVAQLAFTVHEDGTAEGPALKILPVRLTALDKGTDYRPVLAEGETYDRILRKILNPSINMDDFTNPQ